MRAFQIFAGMSPESATAFFERISEKSKPLFDQSVAAAATSIRARPSYLRKQPFDKRAAAVKRALSRVASNAAAEEMLAVYFLECRTELLTEWLDLIGLEHEDGILKGEDPTEPEEPSLRSAVDKYRTADDDPDREILLLAFAAQTSIEWPLLESLLLSES